MKQQIKVGSIIEILNHDEVGTTSYLSTYYPIGGRMQVKQFHPETGEVEVSWNGSDNANDWITFFPGEYKLVE